MKNAEQSHGKPETGDKNPQLAARMKETWSGLSDEDIKLYSSNREQFFTKLDEKQGVSKEDAQKRMQEIEKTLTHPSDKTSASKVA